MYSQNNEDDIISRYFGNEIGLLLSIGENDGVTFSNSRLLIERGWEAHLVEPSPSVYPVLKNLYSNNDGVKCIDVAIVGINESAGLVNFYDSGAHVPNGADIALVSTIKWGETERWRGVNFKQKKVSCTKFSEFYQSLGMPKYDFISIDAEGCDWDILEQIDLKAVGCKCLCIEWNSIGDLGRKYTEHCAIYGLKEIHRNAENIIFAL